MLTLTYSKNSEVSVYVGEIEKTDDYLLTMAVISKNGKALPPKSFRSFDRNQIVEIRRADGQFVSPFATL